MRLLWLLFRFRRRARQTWRLLGREDPMIAVPVRVERDRFAADLSDAELLTGIMAAHAEAEEYDELDEPGPAGMRRALADLLLDEWADRHRGAA